MASASSLQRNLARVSRMDWEEIRVRVGQEIHKRGDLLAHAIGGRAGTVQLREGSASAGQFFFLRGEGVGRARLLAQHLPGDAAELLREADEICAHRFRLLGYKNLEFAGRGDGFQKTGDGDIDWHLDPVHGKRAPMEPWFKIPFLDFSVVGDHKVTWELNRHQHLVTLAKARLLSGDGKYLREIIRQWRSWMKANPYPLGVNWGSSLEVAFRSLSWIWMDHLLAGTPEWDQFHAEMLPALAFHGRYVERYLSTYFSPNTHLIGEAVALFFLGTLYPRMPHSARWKDSGWRVLLREAERQVRPDGVYFEQSLHYHVYALDFFLHARTLADKNAVIIPSEFDAGLERMLDVVAALSQAGPPEGFGDDDGGRLWNPRRNRTEHMTDPLSVGALAYGREFTSARLTEEAVFLFGNAAVSALARTKAPSPPASTAFPDGGIYVLADSQPFSQIAAIDAGPQGVGRSGHGHADALSLRLTMNGRRWLVDSGTGVYIANDLAERNQLRGTAAHNTVRVDGLDQAVPKEAFSWTQIPATVAEEWLVGESFTYFAGSHDGYARLADPVAHRRCVLKIAGGPLLVRDVLLGRMEHDVEILWHFANDLDLRDFGTGCVEVSETGAGVGGAGLSLMVAATAGSRAEADVRRTTLSPAYGQVQEAPMVRCAARVALPAEFATALIPHAAGQPRYREPSTAMRFAGERLNTVQAYELRDDDREHTYAFALGEAAWSFGPWSSDARMLYSRVERGRLAQLLVVGGTEVLWQGQPVLRAALPAHGFFEWRVASSDPESFSDAAAGALRVTPFFEAMTRGLAAGIDDHAPQGVASNYAEKL